LSPAEVVEAVMPTRKSLAAAIADTARIIESPGKNGAFVEKLKSALEQLASSWAAHVTETEAAGGLLNDLVATAPRLCPAVEQLRHDHPALTEELRLLRLRLMGEKASPTAKTRRTISALLAELIHHDQVGAELVWDAYNVDIGGG
jgi:hypothetical protein